MNHSSIKRWSYPILHKNLSFPQLGKKLILPKKSLLLNWTQKNKIRAVLSRKLNKRYRLNLNLLKFKITSLTTTHYLPYTPRLKPLNSSYQIFQRIISPIHKISVWGKKSWKIWRSWQKLGPLSKVAQHNNISTKQWSLNWS